MGTYRRGVWRFDTRNALQNTTSSYSGAVKLLEVHIVRLIGTRGHNRGWRLKHGSVCRHDKVGRVVASLHGVICDHMFPRRVQHARQSPPSLTSWHWGLLLPQRSTPPRSVNSTGCIALEQPPRETYPKSALCKLRPVPLLQRHTRCHACTPVRSGSPQELQGLPSPSAVRMGVAAEPQKQPMLPWRALLSPSSLAPPHNFTRPHPCCCVCCF